MRRTGGIPSLSGKDPVGHIHFLREQRPDVYAATAVFLEPVDYLNLRLTGLARASHDSITLHWVTDNRDIDAIAYDDALIGLAGLERSKLPDLVPTGSVLGGLTAAAAAELGLLPGTPVVAGTGDLHSAAVGSGAVADFDGHLYIGTSSWISCHVPFKKTDPLTNIASIPSGIPGRYLVADEHETGGACLTWLRDNLLFPDDALAAATRRAAMRPPAGFFGTLNDVAASVPVGAHGVMFTPWLNGERSPVDDHTIRGRLPQHLAVVDPGGHGAGRLRGRRAELGLAARTRWRNSASAASTRSPSSAAAPTPTCGRRSTPTPPGAPSARSTDPVLANVRGAGLLTLLALGHLHARRHPGHRDRQGHLRARPAAGEVYAALLKEFVNLYEKTKGIHKRLNGRRLQQISG